VFAVFRIDLRLMLAQFLNPFAAIGTPNWIAAFEFFVYFFHAVNLTCPMGYARKESDFILLYLPDLARFLI